MNIAKAILAGTFHHEQLRWCYHHGRSGTQKMGEQTSQADQTKMQNYTGQAQGTLGQFEGPVQKSPFYKSLYNQGVEATSNAYDRAKANVTQRANMAGFGYNQPVTQGASSQMDAAEAKSMSQVPEQAMLGAAPLALQAAGQTGSMGLGVGAQGVGYYGDAANQDMQRQKSGLWNQLWNLYDSTAQGAGAAMAGG